MKLDTKNVFDRRQLAASTDYIAVSMSISEIYDTIKLTIKTIAMIFLGDNMLGKTSKLKISSLDYWYWQLQFEILTIPTWDLLRYTKFWRSCCRFCSGYKQLPFMAFPWVERCLRSFFVVAWTLFPVCFAEWIKVFANSVSYTYVSDMPLNNPEINKSGMLTHSPRRIHMFPIIRCKLTKPRTIT